MQLGEHTAALKVAEAARLLLVTEAEAEAEAEQPPSPGSVPAASGIEDDLSVLPHLFPCPTSYPAPPHALPLPTSTREPG